MGRHTLKITFHEDVEAIGITLEGRLVGPWVAELSRTWRETAPRRGERKLSLDLRNVTYSDAEGKKVLKDIFSQTGAQLITSSPWTEYLAQEIRSESSHGAEQEA